MELNDEINNSEWLMKLSKTLLGIFVLACFIRDARGVSDVAITYLSMLSLWPLPVATILYLAYRSPSRFVLGYAALYLLTYKRDARHNGSSMWSRLGGGRSAEAIQRFLRTKVHTPYLSELKALAATGQHFVFAVHPHAVFATSTLVHFVLSRLLTREKIGVDFRVMTINLNFLIPLLREWLLARGFVSADPSTFSSLANRGISTVLVPGGSEEALHAYPGSADLVVKKRKGFIREALRTGAWVVPVYAFGDTESVPVFRFGGIERIQRLIQKTLTFATPFALPYFKRRNGYEMNMVIGKPIGPPPETGIQSLEERTSVYHKIYLENLERLFHEYLHVYGTAEEKKGKGIRFLE